MITQEQLKDIKKGQELWWQSIYLYPEEVTVKEVIYTDTGVEIHLEDGTYIPERSFNYLFTDKKECIEACDKELNNRLDKLRLMLKTSKGE